MSEESGESEEPLEDKVRHAEESLVFCDFKECKTRGEFIKCYFDMYRKCDTYLNYLIKIKNEHNKNGD